MTLIELTVVILVLLSLIAILFLGARAWKRGTDRASCIMNIRQVQVAMRSYANLNNRQIGQDISPIDLQNELIGNDQWVMEAPECPAGGTYTYGGNIVPTIGTLYMTCSLSASDRHVPDLYAGW